MPAAPKPANERERLDALWAYEILDTEPEESFDAVTRLAIDIFGVPIAAISLIDENRQWFKSQCGLGDTQSTGRDIAFCAYAILQNEILEIPDATCDPRFAANPLVTGEPFIRFYAGSPIVATDGMVLGTLCLIGREPRTLTQHERDRLGYFAQMTAGLIVARVRRSDADADQLALLDLALAQSNERAKQVPELIALAGALMTAADRDDALGLALNAAQRLFHAGHGSIEYDLDAPAYGKGTQTARARVACDASADVWLVIGHDGAPLTRNEQNLFELVGAMAALALARLPARSLESLR